MKKLKLVSSLMALLLVVLVMSSCDDNNSEVDPILDDSDLIAAIASASNGQPVTVNALPSGVISSLNNNYSESVLSSARLAPELGYQINLTLASGADVGEGATTFFSLDGRELEARNGRFNGRFGNRRLGRRARGLRDCFDFVFPISLTMPDGSGLTLESADDWSEVRSWYEANPDAEGKPEFVFPLDVEFGDSVITINDLEELRSAKNSCEVDRRRGRCFELVFPVDVSLPDGSVISLASRDDWELVRDWYEANPDVEERPSLVYPVNVAYNGDSIVTINSQEEMIAAKAACEVDRDRDRCFFIEYPISFTMPDGTVITLAARSEWTLIRDWYEANPDEEERPDLNFPINIMFTEDSSIVTINSEEELVAARADCN